MAMWGSQEPAVVDFFCSGLVWGQTFPYTRQDEKSSLPALGGCRGQLLRLPPRLVLPAPLQFNAG